MKPYQIFNKYPELTVGVSGKELRGLPEFIQKQQLPNYVLAQQIHSDKIFFAEQPETKMVEGYDAVVTNARNLALIIKTADCLPILIYDPIRKVIAAIHAGRKGTQLAIIAKVIAYLSSKFGSIPGELICSFGPAICVQCYQIDRDKDIHYDLVYENQRQVLSAGIQQLELSGICTACNGNQNYYSYRRDNTELRNYSYIFLN